MQAARYVVCAKCGHANEAGEEVCARCGHSLFVVCLCGAVNERARRDCAQCGHVLRRRHRHRSRVKELSCIQLNSRASGLSRGDSRDLAVALAMFGLVGLLFGSVLLYPVFQAQQRERQEQIEAYREYQRRLLFEAQGWQTDQYRTPTSAF